MLLFTLVSAIVVPLAFATDKCKLDLESILFTPQTYAEKYLKSLSARLLRNSDILFTSQAGSIVDAFEQEYGVTVTLQSQFSTCSLQNCYSKTLTVNSDFDQTPIIFYINEHGTIASLSIQNVQGMLGNTGKSMLVNNITFGISLTPPNASPIQVLNTSCLAGTVPFNFGLADASSLPFSCGTLNDGVTYTPTFPFSQFNGLEAFGEWQFTATSNVGNSVLYSVTIDYCFNTCVYSSDIARSNLNYPGYRYDSSNGMTYYTSVIRNQQGEELYATISRSMDGMFVKK